MANPKPKPNRRQYIEILRRMTPQQRWDKAFELTKIAKDKLRMELRQKFPALPDAEFQQVFANRWWSQE